MKFRVIVIVVLLVLLISACNFSLAEDITPPPDYVPPSPLPTIGPLYPQNPPNPYRGEAIFNAHCQGCHGQNGLGNGPQAASLAVPVAAIGLADKARQSSPAGWYTILTQGRVDRYMPAFRNLNDQQRWDVLAYVYSFSISAEELALGEQLYEQRCTECHGPEGQGASAPTLIDQERMANFTGLALFQTIRDGAPPLTPAFSFLMEEEIWALAAYLRFLTFDTTIIETAVEPTATLQAPSETPAVGESAEPALGDPQEVISDQSTSTASAFPSGTVSGQLTNGSGDGIPLSLTVRLLGFDPDTSGSYQQVLEEVTAVSPDGSFTFEDIELPEERAFIAIIEYDGVQYFSDPVYVSEGDSSVDISLTIYKSSTDTSDIMIDRLHLLFDFSQSESVQILEVFIVSNLSSSTVIADEQGKPVLRFSVPQEALNLTFEDGNLGERYVRTEDGFGDTQGILPGQSTYQLLFAFELPYEKRLEFNLPVHYPAQAVLFMVPEGVEVSGDRITDLGVQDVQNVTVQMYSIENVAAQEVLAMIITGRPKTESVESSAVSSNILVFGLAGLGTLLLVVGVFLFMRERSRGDEENDHEEVQEDNLTDAESIMDAIVALDEQHKTGAISDAVHARRRKKLKQRLRELL